MKDLIISECFGPTLQGEGPSTGKPAAFVRLGMCNLDCHVCDTPYTWDWAGKNGVKYAKAIELTHQTIDGVVAWCAPHQSAGRLIVVTGGEPLVQREALGVAVLDLVKRGPVEIETNGTLPPLSRLAHPNLAYNVSPKTSAMLEHAADRIVASSMEAFTGRIDVRWKFVVATDGDVAEVQELVHRFEIPWSKVWLMPEGVTADALNARLGWLSDVCVSVGANLSHRLHVLAWGNTRGR